MAKLTWTITVTAGVIAQDGPEISEANMQRFRDWLWVKFPQLDAEGNPLARTAAREAQAFRDWADVQWAVTKANVLAHEKHVAEQAARDAVPEIEA